MALPQLYSIGAFDANLDFVFRFSYLGNKVYRNRLQIYNNDTNDSVYNKLVEDSQLRHTVPKGTLQNGVTYYATVECFDLNNQSSGGSNPVLFDCFTTPILEFSNLLTNQKLDTSSYEVSLKYIQPEDEPLNSYQVMLYDSSMQQIFQSGVKYDTDYMTVLLSNLEESTYYIKALGDTVKGMTVESALVSFYVRYERLDIFTSINLTNKPEDGCIQIASNIVSLEGREIGDVRYIDNKMVDLTSDGAEIVFDQNFNINDKFELRLVQVGKPIYGKNILILSNADSSVEIKWRMSHFYENGVMRQYSYLELITDPQKYIIASNYLTNPGNRHFIFVKRLNGLFDLHVTEASV